jgi:16S rRNA (cytosine967-C5)-methyltransferase
VNKGRASRAGADEGITPNTTNAPTAPGRSPGGQTPPHILSGMRTTGDPGRDGALAHLAAQARRFPDLDLRPPRINERIDPRDAALAHLIIDTAVRRWLTLAHLLETRLERPWDELEPEMQGCLLGGAAQLVFLDRVPAYAVINQAVQWAKLNIRKGAAGLANAVLRRVAALRIADHLPAWTGAQDQVLCPDGTAIRLTAPVMPAEPWHRLGIDTSTPRVLVESLRSHLSPDQVRGFMMHSVAQPPITLNTEFASPATLERIDLLRRHSSPGHHVLIGAPAHLGELLNADRGVWVQDVASAACVRRLREHLGGRVPGLIVDLCAGQGTKTRQLALTFPSTQIVATDTDPRRLEVLGNLFGHDSPGAYPNVRVLRPEEVLITLRGQAEVVLLDVPCSNTGVLARRPEARYRATPRQIEQLVQLQRAILEQGDSLLIDRHGGVLVYSTCSIDPRENIQQARHATRAFRLSLAQEQTLHPTGQPGGDPCAYTDGAYSALLCR